MWDKSVKDYFGVTPQKGMFGIEIEAEFDGVFHSLGFLKENVGIVSADFPHYWKIYKDGSIGKEGWSGAEWVLSKPLGHEDAVKAIRYLHKRMEFLKLQLNDTVRTGVHVHLNMQKYTLQELVRFVIIYYTVESTITKFCGEGRESNLFCLRARDCEEIIFGLQNAIEKQSFYPVKGDTFRYAALNLQSLFKFGSVEFRALRTQAGFKNLEVWLQIIERLLKFSLEQKGFNTWSFLEEISFGGTEAWVRKVLGQEICKLLEVPMQDMDMHEDIQNLQELAFAYDKSIKSPKGNEHDDDISL